MKREVSPQKNCDKCGHVVEYKKETQVCDFCSKDIDWNNKIGYPFTLDPIYHKEGDYNRSDEFHFCSLDHGLKWLANHPHILNSHPDDFVSFYIHQKDMPLFTDIMKQYFFGVSKLT